MESKPETIEASKEPSIVQERLNWKIAWRDDAKVAQGLYAGAAIEAMHELSDAGLLDEFFVFLEDVGLMQAFEQMRLPGAKRMLVLTVQPDAEMRNAARRRSRDRSALNAWPTTSANSPRKRWSDSSTRWCNGLPDEQCSPASSWSPWMEANCPLRRAMRAAESSSKPA